MVIEKQFKLFINGEYCLGQGGQYGRENPATGELVGTFEMASKADAINAIKAARESFDKGVWANLDSQDRAAILFRLADLLQEHKSWLGELEAKSLGCPYSNGPSFIEYAVKAFRYFAGLARDIHGDAFSFSNNQMGFTVHEPAGVASLILPWNFPMGELVWKLAPALAVGCSVVVKPDSKTAGTAIELGSLLQEAGVPDGVYNVVVGEVAEIGDTITGHPDIDVVSFTGSSNSGSHIMASAAKLTKPVHLELGGKSPLIILEDADLDKAASDAANAVFWHCGQVCTAASRILVQESIYESFLEKLVTNAQRMQPGAPDKGEYSLGAMISVEHRNNVWQSVDNAVEKGAQLAIDGRDVATIDNAYFGPTIITDVEVHDDICQKEIFGPVTVVLPFKDINQAIEVANATEYGLGAGIWTANINAAVAAARKIKSGSFWINGYGNDRLELPWGGCKRSGFGRELGKNAFEIFTNVKSIHLSHN